MVRGDGQRRPIGGLRETWVKGRTGMWHIFRGGEQYGHAACDTRTALKKQKSGSNVAIETFPARARICKRCQVYDERFHEAWV